MGKVFLTRLLSSIVLTALFVFVYLYANTVVINIFIALVSATCIYELFKATAKDCTKNFTIPSILFAAACPFSELLGRQWVLAVTLVYLLAYFLFLILNYGKVSLENISFTVFLTLFISLSLSTVVYIAGDASYRVTLPLIFAASITDVFAYLVGVTMGKHKLAIHISPKKTIEGVIGGVLGCGLFISVYAWAINRYTSYTINIPALITLGLIIAAVSVIGDLSTSVIKRTYNVKDFGKIIPGHGGALDRVDSWLFTAPIIFIFMNLFTLVS